jgi:chaperonin GroES
MKLIPQGNRILVKRLESESKSPGGIHIPENAKEKPVQGEVLAVGPGTRNEEGQFVSPTIKVGQRVLFGKYAGTEVSVQAEEFVMLMVDDVLAVVEP